MTEISQELIDEVVASIRANKPVRKNLPKGGMVHIDRQLPFLCLYRRPKGRKDIGTDRLARSEASYIVSEGEEITGLVETVACEMAEIFGGFLLLEIWAKREEGMRPSFYICSQNPEPILSTIEALETSLQKVKVHRMAAEVEVKRCESAAPPSLPPVMERETMARCHTYLIGLEINPLYQDDTGTILHPYKLTALRKELSISMKRAFFRFASDMTTSCPTHFAMMGRRLVTKSVFEADEALASVEEAFDFLLQATPINSEEAWQCFRENNFQGTPPFHYRPRPFDTADMKRKLFDIRLERTEDPTLYELFSQKMVEIDRKLTMLRDRDTPDFLYESIPTYGRVEPDLLEMAQKMLSLLPHPHKDVEADAKEEAVDAQTFARAAEKEIAYYKKFYPPMDSKVEIRDDIIAGAMVSGGNFLISSSAHFPKHRIEALLHHEIGTHILTYTNALVQPFKQLRTGLCGYDELQEGIAVLSEYLSGGISRARLRILAARVIAVDALCKGKSFQETFHILNKKYDFGEKSAFTVTTRVFRGGGLTKDAVYLRGLAGIFGYLHGGGALEPLFVGKIAAEHIPLIEELQHREILKKPPLWPRWLELPEAQDRLQEIREKKLTLLDLIEKGYI